MHVSFEIKPFLRKYGFRHSRDVDRGAIWTNGLRDVTVPKNYAKDQTQLRALMDDVRKAAREKETQKQAPVLTPIPGKPIAVPKWPETPETPEQHREAQVAIARQMKDDVSPEAPKDTLPPDAPKPAPPAEESVGERRLKKFKGQERKYVYGRIKAMIEAKMDNVAIAAALQAEGILCPDGKPMSATKIAQCRWSWQKEPARAAKYAAILMPRQARPAAPAPTPIRPVVVAPPPPVEVPRSRFGLPLSVDRMLADKEVCDDERLQVLLIFVELPKSATQLMSDEALSLQQKIAVVEAVGIRRSDHAESTEPQRAEAAK